MQDAAMSRFASRRSNCYIQIRRWSGAFLTNFITTALCQKTVTRQRAADSLSFLEPHHDVMAHDSW
ncbi:MAG: hypothetical protein CMN38_05080 [SAR116 cluster bacterium]|nr:hypothetical protein [SAR116 cluster bacterium]